MSRRRSKKTHYHPKSGTVKLPVFYLIIGILTLPFFAFLCIMGLRESIGFAIVGGVLTILSLAIITVSVNWRITFDPVGFTYRNFFRISRHYSYDEVTAIRFDKTAIIYIGKKIISIEELYDNRNAFLHSLKIHARHARRTESKLFGGNIRNPEEFVFTNWMILIMVIGSAGFMFWSFKNLKPDDLTAVTVDISASSLEKEEDGDEYLALHADGYEKPFKLWYPEDMSDLAEMQAEIEGDTLFTLYYEKGKKSPEEVRTEGAVVHMVTCDAHTHLSLESINRRNREMRILAVTLGAAGTALLGIYVAVSSYIMRHADRFPNAVRWFVKDSYIIRKQK